MMTPLPCPDCAESGIWIITPMREHRFTGFGQIGYLDDLEPMETHICDRCGYTVWYADGFDRLREDPGRIARVDDERMFCGGCDGMRHYLVAQLREWPERTVLGAVPLHVQQASRNAGVGRFALLVCAGCGRCQWFAWGTSGLEGKTEEQQACHRCRAVARRAVEPMREDGGAAIPVAVQKQDAVGHFALTFCNACGFCDWYARDTGLMTADGERVTHVHVERDRANPRVPVTGGPYR